MQIFFLVERREAIPALASCFVAEWPDYYGHQRSAEADWNECLSTERLPIGLVACDGHAPVGFIALRERAITELAGYRPGLGALYVAPSHRSVYAVTARPGKIFTRAGWEDMGPIPHKGQSFALYRWQTDEHSRADTD